MGHRSLSQIIEDTQRDRIFRVLDQSLIFANVGEAGMFKLNPFFAKDMPALAELIREAVAEPVDIHPEQAATDRFTVKALTTVNGSPHLVLRDTHTRGMKITVPTSFQKWAQLAAFGVPVVQE